MNLATILTVLLPASFAAAQNVSVQPICNWICSAAGIQVVAPGLARSNLISFCADPSTSIGVVVVSFSDLSCSGSLVANPWDLIFVDVMQSVGTEHRHTFDVPLAVGPVTWVQQAVYVDAAGGWWTLPEAWQFTIQ